MGRGDKRTKKGKIYSGSFGNIRPKKKKRYSAAAKEAEASK